ncbi:DUF4153 domain-containing protein [Lacinutrix jangbogonensis]|uniref:DUF4153 domain-containing protein n=1 Tax=Lacinutrix jangbogonensis TaxID=1469557 RepID=UPI00068E61EE|nr:DUF4173 domain-containing protein [Lacinutrix jangbogonensis]
MKQTIIIISSLLFSTLFYGQSIGLNLSLFSLLALVILIIGNPNTFKNKTILMYAGLYIITAVLVFFQNSIVAIITNCIAFFTLVGSISQSKSSVFVNWLNGIYTTTAGFFHRNFDYDEKKEQPKLKQDIDILQWVKLIGIPLIFSIVFILLYKNGNTVFNDLISKINFKFINLQWVLFSVLGYYLFNNIINPVQVESATTSDLETGNTLIQTENFSEENLKKEKQLGTTLMLLLNVLIVFYLVTDIIALNSGTTSNAVVLSSQVHSGINALIASIIIAIVIILYFFRGNLNFYKDTQALKNLSFAWIILNAALVILIALKNNHYVTAYGFTYKRVGVYIYLLLTFIGLITTFLKVLQTKNLLFLFRMNTQVAFVLLIGLSTVNWDSFITKYNINNAVSLDVNYLIRLSNNNAFLLNNLRKKGTLGPVNNQAIFVKHKAYLKELNTRNWQEYTFANFQENDNSETPYN